MASNTSHFPSNCKSNLSLAARLQLLFSDDLCYHESVYISGQVKVCVACMVTE